MHAPQSHVYVYAVVHWFLSLFLLLTMTCTVLYISNLYIKVSLEPLVKWRNEEMLEQQ